MQRSLFLNLDEIAPEKMCNYEDKIIIADVCEKDILLTQVLPTRSSAFVFIVIEGGRLEIELDYVLHSLDKNFFLIVLPEHIIHSVRITDNFRARIIIVDREYFGSIEMDKKRIYQPSFFNIKRAPGFLLMEDDSAILYSCLERIKQKILLKKHHLKQDIIKYLLIECLIEVDNMMIERNYGVNILKLTRQEELVYNFLQLLSKNAIKEHQVVYYADKLNITTQYLSLILRQLTGKSTRDWIAHTLIVEAKILLKHSPQSIQQISDKLNFCDASAFGKFFKNLTGITPLEYRKR